MIVVDQEAHRLFSLRAIVRPWLACLEPYVLDLRLAPTATWWPPGAQKSARKRQSQSALEPMLEGPR